MVCFFKEIKTRFCLRCINYIYVFIIESNFATEQEKSHGKELQGEIEQLRETLSLTQQEFRTQMLSNRDELNAANQQLQAVHELALKHGITQLQLEESLQKNSDTPAEQQPEQKDEQDDNQRVMSKLSQSEQIVQSVCSGSFRY